MALKALSSMRAPVVPLGFVPSSATARPAASPALAQRTLLKIAAVVMIGLVLGLSTTAWVLRHRIDIAARQAGPWTLWPKSGTPDIDPYARAIYAQSGQIALASAEGILLSADIDDSGARLTGRCTYQISGEVPPARFWTISAMTEAGTAIDNPAARYGFTSADVLRRSNGSFVIEAAPSVRPGNWLPLGTDRFRLLLRLYDAAPGSVLSHLDVSAVPSIKRESCR